MDNAKFWIHLITAELKITDGIEILSGNEWKEISGDDYEFYCELELIMRENGE